MRETQHHLKSMALLYSVHNDSNTFTAFLLIILCTVYTCIYTVYVFVSISDKTKSSTHLYTHTMSTFYTASRHHFYTLRYCLCLCLNCMMSVLKILFLNRIEYQTFIVACVTCTFGLKFSCNVSFHFIQVSAV